MAAQRTDAELRTTVQDVLRADPDLGAADVEVTVEDGTVRLSGSVPTRWGATATWTFSQVDIEATHGDVTLGGPVPDEGVRQQVLDADDTPVA